MIVRKEFDGLPLVVDFELDPLSRDLRLTEPLSELASLVRLFDYSDR